VWPVSDEQLGKQGEEAKGTEERRRGVTHQQYLVIEASRGSHELSNQNNAHRGLGSRHDGSLSCTRAIGDGVEVAEQDGGGREEGLERRFMKLHETSLKSIIPAPNDCQRLFDMSMARWRLYRSTWAAERLQICTCRAAWRMKHLSTRAFGRMSRLTLFLSHVGNLHEAPVLMLSSRV